MLYKSFWAIFFVSSVILIIPRLWRFLFVDCLANMCAREALLLFKPLPVVLKRFFALECVFNLYPIIISFLLARAPLKVAFLQEKALDQLEQYLEGLPLNDSRDQDPDYYLISPYP